MGTSLNRMDEWQKKKLVTGCTAVFGEQQDKIIGYHSIRTAKIEKP